MRRLLLVLVLVFLVLLLATPVLAQDDPTAVPDTALADFFEYLIARFELRFIAGGLGLLLAGVEVVQWTARKFTSRDPDPQLIALVFVAALVGIKGLVNTAGVDETQVAGIVDLLNRIVQDFGPWVLGAIGVSFGSALTAPRLKASGAPGFRSKTALKYGQDFPQPPKHVNAPSRLPEAPHG